LSSIGCSSLYNLIYLRCQQWRKRRAHSKILKKQIVPELDRAII
jgi:hypothetical protein